MIGTMLVQQGLDGFAKYYNHSVGTDRFNFENESFEQSRELVENEYSVNIPMLFYFKKKMNKGWINIINPFRGTRARHSRFRQVFRNHRPVHKAAFKERFRHDGV